MKIKKMTATFGKLKNSKLELEPGLNIIYAPNEYGKSTWCSFIKAMLYGVDTSERDRIGHISAKTRIRPWDGSATAGTMEITHNGKDITMQRTNKGSAPFRNLLAVYTGTADFVGSLTGETAGEELTGVSEQVFERTAFIRRPEMRVSQTSDLEKRISSLVAMDDEQSSYSEADALLRLWQRKIKYNRSGTLPSLEEELRQAEAERETLNQNASELADLRSNISRLTSQRESLREDLVTHEKLEKRSTARRIKEMQAKSARYEEEVNALRSGITRGDHVITRDDINDMRSTASSVPPLYRVKTEAEKTYKQAERSLEEIKEKAATSPLSPMTEEEAGSLIRRAMELKEKSDKAQEKKKPTVVPVLLIAVGFILMLFTSGILKAFATNMGLFTSIEAYTGFNLVGLIPALALMAAGVYMMLRKPKENEAQLELDGIFAKYGVQSVDKLSAVSNAYIALLRQEAPASTIRDNAKESFDSAQQNYKDAEEKALKQIAELLPGVTSSKEIAPALAEIEATIEKLTKAEFDMMSCRNVYETLISEYEGDYEADDAYLPTPLRSREDTEAALMRTEKQLAELKTAYDMAQGAQRSLSDPVVIESRIQTLNEKIASETEKYDALSLAIDTLSEASTELQTRFSPLISRKTSEILARITADRYEKVSFARGFDANAQVSDDPAARNVLALSDGTIDEIYFSLRLAMCELILTGDDPCPIILDDALLTFDDERCKTALELLCETAETRQVILFSCHSRESDMMAGKPNVNIINTI